MRYWFTPFVTAIILFALMAYFGDSIAYGWHITGWSLAGIALTVAAFLVVHFGQDRVYYWIICPVCSSRDMVRVDVEAAVSDVGDTSRSDVHCYSCNADLRETIRKSPVGQFALKARQYNKMQKEKRRIMAELNKTEDSDE